MRRSWTAICTVTLVLGLPFGPDRVLGAPAEVDTSPDVAALRADQAYQRVLAQDDRARTEIDQWIVDQQKDPLAESPLQGAALKGRIEERLNTVRLAYEAFLDEFPDHAQGWLAYGSFLNEIQEEEAARQKWEKSKELDPSNPAVWNNLGNYHGHSGEATNAFAHYEQALRLNPKEPIYYQNLATTLYMFRRDGTNYYRLTVPQVLEKAMSLYGKALELDPENFILASEIAQTYYGIPAPRTGSEQGDAQARREWLNKALAAWRQAYALARDDIEREGVNLHVARVLINAERFDEARDHLSTVTNDLYRVTKRNLSKLLDERRQTVEGPPSP